MAPDSDRPREETTSHTRIYQSPGWKFYDRAKKLFYQGRTTLAVRQLQRALLLTPEWQNNPSTIDFATRLTGLPADEAIQAVLDAEPPRRLPTWRDVAIIVLLAILAAIPVSFRWVWLAPPRLRTTLYCYDVLALIWIPVLLVIVGRRSDDVYGCWVGFQIVSIAVLASVASCGTCMIVSTIWPSPPVVVEHPPIGSYSLTDNGPIVVFLTLHFSDVYCRKEELSGGRLRYQCTPWECVLDPYQPYHFTFEGRRGSPFVRLVQVESAGGCD